MAKLGFGLLMVMQNEWAKAAEDIMRYREIATEAGHTPRPPIILTNVCCAESRDEAHERAFKYLGQKWQSIDDHYHFSDGHLATVKGYESYGKMAQHLRQDRRKRRDPARRRPISTSASRSSARPRDCLEKIAELQRLTGLDHLVTEYSFGAMPHEEAELNMRLFADKVLPMLQRDPAFAGTGVPADRPGPLRPGAGAPVRPGLSVADLHHPRAPGAIHSGAKGINSDPRRWHGITGGGIPSAGDWERRSAPARPAQSILCLGTSSTLMTTMRFPITTGPFSTMQRRLAPKQS